MFRYLADKTERRMTMNEANTMNSGTVVGVMPDLANSNGTRPQGMINFLPEQEETYYRKNRGIRDTEPCAVTVWQCVEQALKAEPDAKECAKKRVLSGKRASNGDFGRSEDIIARQFGFASANGYRFAKHVYYHGHASVKRLVEQGVLKMTPASRLAGLPPHLQQKAALAIGAAHMRGCSSRLIGRIVAVACSGDTIVYNTLHNAVMNAQDKASLTSVLSSCKSDDISEQRNGCIKEVLHEVHTVLSEIIFRINSERAGMDDSSLTDIYEELGRIEKLAAHMREHMGLNTGDEAFWQTMTERHTQLRGTVQFFSHYLLRKKIVVPSSLRDELSCSFHNAVVVLSCIAETLTFCRGDKRPRPASHPGMIHPQSHSGYPEGAPRRGVLRSDRTKKRSNKKRRLSCVRD